jgi:peptidoglycan/xylan/chitin deacetylase (PgdA/CDA1 family)
MVLAMTIAVLFVLGFSAQDSDQAPSPSPWPGSAAAATPRSLTLSVAQRTVTPIVDGTEQARANPLTSVWPVPPLDPKSDLVAAMLPPPQGPDGQEPGSPPSNEAQPFPEPTPDGTARIVRVPILMYHYVSTPPDHQDALRVDLSVPPERFAEHLDYLRARGYTTISLNDLALALQTGHPLPRRAIILTFDDGYLDHYTHAFPILKAHGYTGTFFVVTGYIDQGRPEYLSWEQVMDMHAAGMRIEAHGHTHVDLRDRGVDYLVWQLLGAKEAIEARTHEPVRFFCYPSGKYDEQAIAVLHSAHYWGAVTVNHGSEHYSERMFELERLRIHGDYEVSDLAALLAPFEEAEAPGPASAPDEAGSQAASDVLPVFLWASYLQGRESWTSTH